MPAIVYREHLDLFNKYKVQSVPYGKILSALALTFALTLGATFAYTSRSNQQIEPVNEQASFYQSIGSSYYKSKQSLNDLRTSLQVAGVKVEKIDSLREASASSRVPGFFTTIGDIQKTIDQIKTTRESIATEKETIAATTTPEIYQTLDSQIVEYQEEAESFLSGMEKSQIALKDLITAATPAFFLPVLSDEEVWQRGDIEEIKAYYEKKKLDSEETLNNFITMSTVPELLGYKEMQQSHMTLVKNVSENILAVLSRPTPEDEEGKMVLKEEAYQVLVGAQRENEELASQLAEERVSLSSLNNYTNELATLGNRERVIESGLSQDFAGFTN